MIRKLQDRRWNAHLQNLLHYHMYDHGVALDELEEGTQVWTMQNDETITVTQRPGTRRVHVNNNVLVLADYQATNGQAYMLEEVLLPSWTSRTLGNVLLPDNNNNNNGATDVSTFARLLVQVQSEEILFDPSASWTLLVPTDDAFASLEESALLTASGPQDMQTLRKLLLLHVIVGGPFPSLFFSTPTTAAPMTLVTMADEKTIQLVVTPGAEGNVVGPRNQAVVIKMDQSLSNNGLIHEIDTVLLLDDDDTNSPTTAPTTSVTEFSPTSSPTMLAFGFPGIRRVTSVLAGMVDVYLFPAVYNDGRTVSNDNAIEYELFVARAPYDFRTLNGTITGPISNRILRLAFQGNSDPNIVYVSTTDLHIVLTADNHGIVPNVEYSILAIANHNDFETYYDEIFNVTVSPRDPVIWDNVTIGTPPIPSPNLIVSRNGNVMSFVGSNTAATECPPMTICSGLLSDETGYLIQVLNVLTDEEDLVELEVRNVTIHEIFEDVSYDETVVTASLPFVSDVMGTTDDDDVSLRDRHRRMECDFNFTDVLGVNTDDWFKWKHNWKISKTHDLNEKKQDGDEDDGDEGIDVSFSWTLKGSYTEALRVQIDGLLYAFTLKRDKDVTKFFNVHGGVAEWEYKADILDASLAKKRLFPINIGPVLIIGTVEPLAKMTFSASVKAAVSQSSEDGDLNVLCG